MTKHWFFVVLILLFFKLPAELNAQVKTIEADSLPALANAISFYKDMIYHDSYIYEGQEYTRSSDLTAGHPYFEFPRWTKGNLNYKGRYYPQVDMLYDIVTDEVVVMHPQGALMISLPGSEISRFSLADHRFIRISAERAKGSILNEGFYEQPYKGESQVLIKRKKNFQPLARMSVTGEFVQKDAYFIEKEGLFYRVTNKSSVLRLLRDQKKEVRRSLKEHNIKFRKNPELAIVKMVEYYDGANSSK
ncbi:hypothetical protein D770_16260 [Flammeovirgaceae bacterium 311]|nr:hypothetical protein D770_16260 [Flammeovirgaceae bacterium 311]